MSSECETTVMAVARERNAGRGTLNTGLRNVILHSNGYETISGEETTYLYSAERKGKE